MPFPAGVEIDPPGLIEAWRRDVASRSGVSNGQPRWARQHAMNLRARTPRGHLTEIASNRRRPKREAPTTTEDPARKKLKGMDSTNVTPMKQKKRGRPSAEDIVRRRQLENQEQSEQSINLGPLVPGSVPSLPPSEAGSRLFSSRKKSASPSKRSRTLDQTKSPAAIDLTFLETCKPSTKMRIFSEVRQKGIDIPAAVLHLHEKLLDTPEGFIPSELKEAYRQDANTPRKSGRNPRGRDYMVPGATSYPEGSLPYLKDSVAKFYSDAQFNHKYNVHERQWTLLVAQILGEVRRWPCGQKFRLLNVENCSIEPVECRPTMPNGDKLDCDVPSESPVAKETDTTKDTDASKETGQTISKMIDLCLSLVLDEEELDIIADGFKIMRYNERSLNQSLDYIVHCALFLDIEIKKSLQNRNPEVQLAIWAAGALLKKQLHKWDTSMPISAIAVSGHTWIYYLFFECSGNLMMMSPEVLGSTVNLLGTWEIIWRLHILCEWGVTEYRQWFQDHILAWFQGRSKA